MKNFWLQTSSKKDASNVTSIQQHIGHEYAVPGLLQAIVDGIMELNYLLKRISSHLEKIFFYLALVPL
jgi:hypothetical protein